MNSNFLSLFKPEWYICAAIDTFIQRASIYLSAWTGWKRQDWWIRTIQSAVQVDPTLSVVFRSANAIIISATGKDASQEKQDEADYQSLVCVWHNDSPSHTDSSWSIRIRLSRMIIRFPRGQGMAPVILLAYGSKNSSYLIYHNAGSRRSWITSACQTGIIQNNIIPGGYGNSWCGLIS